REGGRAVPPACATPWRVHRCRRGIFAVALVAAVSVPARAQDAAARTDEGPARTELPEVEIVAERPHGSLRAPGSETTVVEANRFAGEVRSVAELLATPPGVSVHALGGPGQAATLSLRGASADQSAVLLDGIPLQGPGGGAVDLATLPATLLDRVIISRGVLGAQSRRWRASRTPPGSPAGGSRGSKGAPCTRCAPGAVATA